MIQFIIYLLLSFGITNIIVRESITKTFRDFVEFSCGRFITELINCETCLGFWIGLGIFWLLPLDFSWYILMPISAFVSSGWNKLCNLLIINIFK